jgi:ELWxxDGT repeat protein
MKKKFLSAFIASFLAFGFSAQQFNQISSNLNNNLYGNDLNNFADLNGNLIFTNGRGQQYSGYLQGIFKSDGTINGTNLIFSLPAFSNVLENEITTSYDFKSFVKLGNQLIFKVRNSSSYNLWKTDGTAIGTSLINDFQDKEFCSNLCELNGNVYFLTRYDDPNGSNITHELWKSDGTLSGTLAVQVWFNSNNFSNCYNNKIRNFNNKIYFSGFESNGSTSGTIQTNVFLPNESESCSYNGCLYYKGTDSKIWKTDGTNSGTTLAVDFPASGNFYAHNGWIYFSGGYSGVGQAGNELCKTDGTTINTSMIKDINLGYNSSFPNSFKSINNQLLFLANDGIHGNEFWVTDGSSAGTNLIKDLKIGSLGLSLEGSAVHNNQLYFSSNNIQRGIWKTDGTEPNTFIVQPADTVGPMLNIDCKLFVVLDTMQFDQLGNYLNNSELWSLINDCSSVGLTQKEDFNSWSVYPNPTSHSITIKGKEVMKQSFSIFDQMGREVYKGKLNGIKTDVYLTNLSKGIYTLKIDGNYKPVQIVKE